MKALIYTLTCFLLTALFAAPTCSQTVTRQPNETPERFVKRTFNIDELPHPVIETGEWDSTKKAIIFFKEITGTEDDGIVGYLLSPLGNNAYAVTLIDTIYAQGGQRGKK